MRKQGRRENIRINSLLVCVVNDGGSRKAKGDLSAMWGGSRESDDAEEEEQKKSEGEGE